MLKLMSDHDSEQVGGPWLSYEKAAAHTDLSESYLRQLVMAERVPYRKVGRRVLFSVPELDAWVSRGGAMADDQDAA